MIYDVCEQNINPIWLKPFQSKIHSSFCSAETIGHSTLKLKGSGSETLPHQEPWGRKHVLDDLDVNDILRSWYIWIIWFPQSFSQKQPCFPCENSLNWEPWQRCQETSQPPEVAEEVPGRCCRICLEDWDCGEPGICMTVMYTFI